MYSPETTETFRAKMKKLAKRDKPRYEMAMGKIEDILKNPQSQKPLGNVIAGVRRAHIDPYVLTYDINEERKTVRFLDFEHHDKIYKN